jgi:integrase
MANLGRKAGIFHVRFRYAGREYKRSLKVRDRVEAEAAKRTAEQTIHRLLVGLVALPAGVDPGDFVVSGGTRLAPAGRRTEPISADGLVAAYLDGQRHRLAASTHALFTTHLGHWKRHLGPRAARRCDLVTHRDLETFLQARAAATSEATAAKERRTLRHLFRWAVRHAYLEASPAEALAPLRGETDRPRFRTLSEVGGVIARGGLSPAETLDLWESVFLSPTEIGELLGVVRGNSLDDLSPLLHALPAYTGMRRGEVLRLRWSDVDFPENFVFARSRKQSRQHAEVIRRIDMHPELRQILAAWRECRPRGQFVVCRSPSLEPLTPDQANRLFWQPMRHTAWCLDGPRNWFKMGFHTYRHSFASNLAARGIDQRVIDEWMGHSTEAMRRRYRHLFPSSRRSAIESFSLRSAVA